jgi:primosomal protein N'
MSDVCHDMHAEQTSAAEWKPGSRFVEVRHGSICCRCNEHSCGLQRLCGWCASRNLLARVTGRRSVEEAVTAAVPREDWTG